MLFKQHNKDSFTISSFDYRERDFSWLFCKMNNLLDKKCDKITDKAFRKKLFKKDGAFYVYMKDMPQRRKIN